MFRLFYIYFLYECSYQRPIIRIKLQAPDVFIIQNFRSFNKFADENPEQSPKVLFQQRNIAEMEVEYTLFVSILFFMFFHLNLPLFALYANPTTINRRKRIGTVIYNAPRPYITRINIRDILLDLS